MADSTLQVSVDVRRVKASGVLPSLLRVPAQSSLTEYEYVSYLQRSALSMARVYVPRSVAKLAIPKPSLPRAGRSPWGDDVQDLLAAAGIHVATTVERLVSRLPSTEEAQLLRSTTPVLVVQRTSSDAAGRIVAGAFVVLAGDRTEVIFTNHTHVEAPRGTR
ncbi:UTRA domain-containing protein [Streptomyces griseocarneus]|nr:UTRA domain-containing protein [Streptomyces griseocarneus]